MTTPAIAIITLLPVPELLAAWLANGPLPRHRTTVDEHDRGCSPRTLPFVPAGWFRRRLSGALCTLFDANPIKAGVCVEPTTTQEPDERHAELPGDVYGEAARGGDGADD